MRACEGCRRRKIKCDAATTNTWPCSACIRLKLHCVPPTVNYDQDFASNPQGSFESGRTGYEDAASGEDEYRQMSMQQQMSGPSQKSVPPIYTQQVPYPENVCVYQYGEPSSGHSQQNMQYAHLQTPVSVLDQHHQYSPQTVFPTPPLQQQSHSESPDTYEQDQYGQQNLADLLGDLRMDETGTGINSSFTIKIQVLM